MSEERLLARLELELDNSDIDYRKSSTLQGVIFEHIDSYYVEKMHMQQMHPYSQYVIKENNKIIWNICSTSNEAYENIIEPLGAEEFKNFNLKHNNIDVPIVSKHLVKLPYSDLMADFYNKKADRMINLRFLSLTSFRQRGRYNVVPDLRLIYQSLMMRYSINNANEDMIDEDTLEQLCENSEITRYRLHTGIFPLEGQKIPGYMGELSFKINGTETMARYARMLLKFGEFSGVGVKTGMGMGAIRIVQEEGNVRQLS